MQDKLIEAVAQAIWTANTYPAKGEQPDESSMNDYRRMAESAIAAVRAHDAGTDEGLRKARVQDAFDKIASANTVTICSLDEMESIVNRALDGEFDADLRVRPASHAAESAPQLDAEDPADPVEDVVSRMLDLFFDEVLPLGHARTAIIVSA